MSTLTLDTVLDSVMLLPSEEREMLVEIVHNRQSELHREQLLRDAEEGLAAFRTGELQPQTAKEIIAEYRASL